MISQPYYSLLNSSALCLDVNVPIVLPSQLFSQPYSPLRQNSPIDSVELQQVIQPSSSQSNSNNFKGSAAATPLFRYLTKVDKDIMSNPIIGLDYKNSVFTSQKFLVALA